MTRGDIPWRFLNRPVKPLAFFISMTLLTIFYFNVVLDTDLVAGAMVGDVVGSLALVGFMALIGGWATKSQIMAEIGLIIAVFVWLSRSMMILLTVGPQNISLWLSLAWVGTISGAYVLESMDANGRGHFVRGTGAP